MSTSYVVIDLETTGLDIYRDKIIEVAAVKIKRGLITDEFSTLISIDSELSEEISVLTGITAEMLQGQPRIEDIIPALADFIGDADIIAHNAEFDHGFLSRFWTDDREWIDSITLAQIIYPCEPSHSLSWLTGTLNIDNHNAHRALSDALATAELFILMEKDFSLLSEQVKTELVSLCQNDQSPLAGFIRLRCETNAPLSQGKNAKGKNQFGQKREINEDYILDIKKLEQYLGTDAAFKERITDFEERPQQLTLAKEVAKTLNNGGCLLAEAGTGTGKSLAYLLPATLYSLGSGKQIAVSTHTRNLQEQLLGKDIPMLCQLLNTKINAAVLKGRGNYLCNRLYKYFSQEPTDELRYFLMRVAVWKASSQSGDSGEMSLNSYSRRKWQRLCATKDNCAPFCPNRQSNTCWVQKARIKASEADILILNHSLLIANAAREAGFLPELPYLIIDEAQHLESATEDQLTTSIDFFDILNLISRYKRKEKGKNIGIIATLTKFQGNLYEQIDLEHLSILVDKLDKDVDAIIAAAEKFYEVLDVFFQSRCAASCFVTGEDQNSAQTSRPS